MEEGINVKTNNKMLKFIVKPRASGILRNAALKKVHNGLWKSDSPAEIGITFKTWEVKSTFSSAGLLPLSALRLVISQGGRIFSFKLAGNSSSGDILYHLHISIKPSSAGIRRGTGRNRMLTKWLPATRLLAHLSDSMFHTLTEIPVKAAFCLRAGQVSLLTPRSGPWHRALRSWLVVPGFTWTCQLFSLRKQYIACHNLQEFVDTTYVTQSTRFTI